MNADAGFNYEDAHMLCSEKEIETNIADNSRNNADVSEAYEYFDDELYKEHYVIERTNAWLDNLK